MKHLIFLGIITTLLVSCNVSPQHIEYGTDACHYCNMTIVDRQHASQVVTTKGKAFKYDAIECMVHSLQDDLKDTEIALHLVADFDQPGKLMDATMASYLVSDKISSPMGANLSAFENEKAGEKAKEKFTGELYSWEKIQKHLKK
ncbi:nitrous oxide reductase accessory protein NosL [Aequorivita nionensis]|uniref:nitrous oxide reductase accessory protein NosL n=1 Tax=Aequorivita nionensis TaxID=1287690 RepID=UPI003965BB17